MSWLLKEATVLSSVVVVPKRHWTLPWAPGRRVDMEISLVLQGRRWVQSIFANSERLVAVCDPDMVVSSIYRLKPNRVHLLSLRARPVVVMEARVGATCDLHVGDKLEIR